jgi:hypothetical protein
MRSLGVLVAVLLLLPVGAGGADEPEPIGPDRASLANGTGTVGPGAVQVETGLQYAHERIGGSPSERRFRAEAALRVGIGGRLEVGVLGEPFVRLRGETDDTGHGDFTFNVKYRFFDPSESSPLPSLAVMPFVTLPVTEAPLGSGKTDFGAIMLASFDLPGRLGLDLNGGMSAIGQTRPDGYLLQAFVAAGVSRDLTETVVLFGDVAYTSRQERGGGDQTLLDLGVVWRPARDVAVDASMVSAVAGPGPDWAARAGVSVRFGR